MDLSYSLDILFMILAFLAVRRTLPSMEQINQPESEPSTPVGLQLSRPNLSSRGSAAHSPSTPIRSSPSPSPLASGVASPLIAHARRDSLAVPTITLTPDLVSRARPKHDRKSVSFSLSSMDELMAKRPSTQKRPPTPYTQGPAHPISIQGGEAGKGNEQQNEEIPAMPLGVEQIRSSPEKRDSMGVKKEWLMPTR